MAIAAVAGLASAIGASAAGFAFFSFAAGGFAAFAGYFALGAGLSMVSRALAPRPNMGAQMRGITQTTREPAGSRKIIYGKMRVGGNVVFIAHSGHDNKYLHLAVVFATHHINSYEEVWFNDNKIWTASGGFQSDWGTYVTMDTTKLGTSGQSASSLLTPIAEWTADHKLSGIAYIAFKLEWNQDKFPQGVPNITAVVKGKRVFDPRTSVTAYSTNPALCLRDYMLDQSYGLGESNLNIDSTALNAAADLCDEQVSLDAGGTQDRYQCNGVIDTSNQIKANIEQLLASMGGKLTYSGGKYFVDGAEYKTPTHTFTEADVISEIQTQTKQSRRGIYNGVKGIFVSEEKNYKVLDYPAQISSTYATEDGDPLYLDMPLPFVTNNLQAQRLAKIALLKSRQQVVITMTVNLKGLQVKVGDTIQITNDRLNYSSKVFEVIDYSLAIGDGQALAVNLVCIETASAIYDWTTSDEEDFLSGGELDLYDGRTVDNVTSLTFTEIGLRGPDGGVSSSVQLTWTAPTDAFIEFYKIRYNKTGTTNYFEVQSRETNVFVSGLDVTSNYDFRVQAENLLGVTSTGTTLSNQALNGDTTAPSAPTGGAATGGIQTITAEWNNPSDIDFKHVEVYVNTSDSIPASPTALVDGEEYVVTGLSGAVTRYFWLKSVDFSGNKSAATASFNGTSLEVAATDIADNAVGSDQIASDAVGSDQIANDAVGSDQIADDAVGSDQLASGAVNLTAFASGIQPVQVVSTLPASASQGDMAFLTTDNNLYRYNGSAWTKAITLTEVSDSGALAALSNIDLSYVTDSGNLAALNTVGSSQIDDDAITNAKIAVDAIQGDVIAAGAITATKIGTDAVTTAKIANDAITTDLIAAGAITTTEIGSDAITTAKIAANAITASEIAAGAVTANEIAANTITAGQIATGAITADEIAANAVTAAAIAANTITASEIAAGAVTATEIAAGTITASELAADSVTANAIAAGSVAADEIAAGAVTTAKLAAGAVTANEIASNTVTAAQIASNTITANEIASSTITANELAAGTITSNEIAANTITAGQIAAGAINTDELAANAVTAAKIQASSITVDKLSGDVSELFPTSYNEQLTLTNSNQNTVTFTLPAPELSISKRIKVDLAFDYLFTNSSTSTTTYTTFFSLQMKSKGATGVQVGDTNGVYHVSYPHQYNQLVYIAGNHLAELDTNGRVGRDSSGAGLGSINGVYYDGYLNRTYILVGQINVVFTTGDTLFYSPTGFTSTGTFYAPSATETIALDVSANTTVRHRLVVSQTLGATTTATDFRGATRMAISYSNTTIKLSHWSGTLELIS